MAAEDLPVFGVFEPLQRGIAQRREANRRRPSLHLRAVELGDAPLLRGVERRERAALLALIRQRDPRAVDAVRGQLALRAPAVLAHAGGGLSSVDSYGHR